ncbi:MAG: rod shape-determining protein RodA [Clostridia bacterium]|nr:rod shape-determining protein RodA [Clostridia bacterium]
MVQRKMLRNLDYVFILTIMVILGFSLVMLSSANLTIPGDPTGFVKKQSIWIVIGSVALIVAMAFDYNHIAKYNKYLYMLNIVLLTTVLLIGSTNKGATSWISFGLFDFQPSEVAKVIIIITFAKFLVDRQGKLDTFWQLIPCFMFVGFPMLFILVQPDLGTSLVFLAIMFGMLFVAGANPKVLLTLIIGGLIGVSVLIYVHFNFGLWLPLKEYQVMRLVVFTNPYIDELGSGYHMIQSLIAIGSGGLWGQGLYEGSQIQLRFLPEHHTDFIFSVVGEELGFIGGGFLLVSFYLLMYRGVKIAYSAKDLYGTLIVIGIISMFTFQVFVNVGMTIAITPITGLPLPFVSYGGSAMLTNMIAVGLILNVNIRRQDLLF